MISFSQDPSALHSTLAPHRCPLCPILERIQRAELNNEYYPLRIRLCNKLQMQQQGGARQLELRRGFRCDATLDHLDDPQG